MQGVAVIHFRPDQRDKLVMVHRAEEGLDVDVDYIGISFVQIS